MSNVHDGSVERALIDLDIGHLGLHFPSSANPFYITAPPYTRMSAGIKVLHLLCHHLNVLGYEAYLVIYPPIYEKNVVHPALKTPLLTQEVVDAHFEQGRLPITIYPEIVRGNPMEAPLIVRYIMNYIGLLGGDTSYPAEDYLLGYSKKLSDSFGQPERILFLPLSNRDMFYPPKDPTAKREGGCFTASKYKHYHGAKTFPITDGLFEVTRALPDSLSQEKLGELFRRSEVFYTYENTSLALDAVLCGCPTVFLPNPHLVEILGMEELKNYGFAWGNSDEQIAHAKRTLPQAQAHFQSLQDEYFAQLSRFVIDIYSRAAGQSYTQKIVLPTLSELGISALRIKLVYQYWRRTSTLIVFRKAKELYKRDGISGLLGRFSDIFFAAFNAAKAIFRKIFNL